MKKRCYQVGSKSYADYGGCGIFVCPEWRTDPVRFVADMGPRPKGHSIERIDNNGPYSPANCRWAKRSEQLLNTRRNTRVTFNGQTKFVHEWAKQLGIRTSTLNRRINRGWSPEAVMSPGNRTDQTRETNRYLEFMGERRCVTEWARIMGIPHGALYARLRMGWTVEQALTKPIRH